MVKKLPANAGDVGLIPESGRSPGEGKGNVGGAEGREGTGQSGHSLVGHGEDLGFGSE